MAFRRDPALPGGPNTEQVRKALDALTSDTPLADSDLILLTESERDEVAALTRTAHLTRVVLHSDSPSTNAESEALLRAQAALRNRMSTYMPPQSPRHVPRSSTSWLNSILERIRDSDGNR